MRPIVNKANDFLVLNEDLRQLYQWAQQWRVTFNASKTEYMIFSNKNVTPKYPELYLGNSVIKQVDTDSHLGLTLDTKLNWKHHISMMLLICTKASQRVSNIKRIRHLIPRKTAEILYKSLSRPILEYGDVIFDNTTQEMKKLIDHVQRNALVMITLAYRRTPTVKLYEETGLETLADRRKQHKLILYYKMINKLVPNYLCDLVPPPSGENCNYQLRSQAQNKLTVPYARTCRYANYFVINTTKSWNNLDMDVRHAQSINVFKSKLKTSHSPHVAAFLTGRAAVHHTRMRLGLSPLREHLYNFCIVDSPTCEYCFIEHESCIHYFLKCPSFSVSRCKLLSGICNVVPFNILCKLKRDQELVSFFLRGSDQLSSQDN